MYADEAARENSLSSNLSRDKLAHPVIMVAGSGILVCGTNITGRESFKKTKSDLDRCEPAYPAQLFPS